MNKAVFITGAQMGTGYAIAERFAKEGYDVFITSRRGADAPGQSQDWSPGVSGAKSWIWASGPTRRGLGGPFPKLRKISG